ADVEAVPAREHDVEHDGVIVARRRHPEGVVAVLRDVGGEALLGEAPPDEAGHLHVVLDDQDAHLTDCPTRDERRMRASPVALSSPSQLGWLPSRPSAEEGDEMSGNWV